MAQGLPWPLQESCQLSRCSPRDHRHATTDTCDPHNLGKISFYTHEEIGDLPHVICFIHVRAQSPISRLPVQLSFLEPHSSPPLAKKEGSLEEGAFGDRDALAG